MPRKARTPTYYRDRECPTCHCFFTPQGLGGHLRFAHKGIYGEKDPVDALKEVEERKLMLKVFALSSAISEQQRDAALRWLNDWQYILLFGRGLGLRFTDQDFKQYIMTRIMGQGQPTII